MESKVLPMDSHAELVRRMLFEREMQSAVFAKPSPLFTKSKHPAHLEDTAPEEGKQQKEVLPVATLTRKPFYVLLSLLGALPFTVNSEGQPKFKLLSPISAYSLSVYVGVMLVIYREVGLRFDISSGQVDKVVDSFSFLLFHAKYALIPLVMWLPVGRMTTHQNRWKTFQENFLHTTGHELKFELQKATRLIAAAIPLLSAVICGIWVSHYAPSEPWLLIIYMAPLMTSLTFNGLWCTSYIILALSADQITGRLKEELTRHRGSPGLQEHVMREYRALWLELSRLLQSNNDVSTVTFTYHTAHVFLMLTLSLYAVLSGLRAQWDFEQTIRISSTVVYLFELWAIANAAHYTATKFDAIQWDSYWLIPASDTPANVMKEMSTLLEVAAASPRLVDIGGFVTINRSWLTNMLGNLLSSLIILLQFKVSQNGGEAGAGGANVTFTPLDT